VKIRQKEQGFLVYFLLIGLMLALSPITPNTAFAAPPTSSTWTLTWSDEFNGTAIDPNKWSWGQLSWGGQYHGEYYSSWITPEDSYLEDGSLILRCRKATGDEFDGYPWSEGWIFGNEWTYYGYVEIRARYPLGKGIWNGLWMLHYGWPPEFDIAEYFGTNDRMHNGLCYKFGTNNYWDSVWVYDDHFENWHTYGLEWYPGGAKWYRDGILKHTVARSQVPDVPMYTILQSGMDWTYDGTTPNPNYYEVDYIRWYKDDNLPRYQSEDFLPTIIDAMNDGITYSGTWYPWSGNPAWMANEYYSIAAGSVAEFSFTGTKVAYFSVKRYNLGYAEILLDGELVDTIDLYSAANQYHTKLYQSPELEYGEHTIGVRVKGTKNPASSGVYVILDAFRYSPYTNSYDITSDGKVNFEDLQAIADQWLQPPGIPSADIAPAPLDEFVDFLDFAALANHWWQGTTP